VTPARRQPEEELGQYEEPLQRSLDVERCPRRPEVQDTGNHDGPLYITTIQIFVENEMIDSTINHFNRINGTPSLRIVHGRTSTRTGGTGDGSPPPSTHTARQSTRQPKPVTSLNTILANSVQECVKIHMLPIVDSIGKPSTKNITDPANGPFHN